MVEDGWRLPLSLTLIQCQCSARVCVGGKLSGSLLGENRGLQWSRTGGPYISVIVPPFILSLPMINQIHCPLRSAVSCYLVTMICLGCLCFHGDCAHPVISLAVLSQWPVATPGPDPQLPASLPHGPVRLSVCVHVAVQPPHRARLVKATSGPSLWWLSEQTKRVDIIDGKYAVSTLPRNANMKRKDFKKGQKLFPGWKCPAEVWWSLYFLYINLPFHLWEPWWILSPILNLAMMDSCQWSI